ncbi:hypothetical protein DFH27DRAFT_487020 [Peziza echinospora]|nr:hypothetical protein DFH27DRAFT_487020 [Peziza echinospora]
MPPSPPPPLRHLIVCGGNGFLGSRICQTALTRGWSVTSISRRGAPSPPPPWSDHPNMTWHSGNILHPNTYSHLLSTATAVVHSMGILLEADYKGVISGQEPIISGIKKVLTNTGGSADASGSASGGGGRGDLTYETMNRDSALLLAKEYSSSTQPKPTFVYISAADGALILPNRYISTKREAETGLTKLGETSNIRTILVRPAFLYDSSRPVTIPLAFATGVTSAVNGLFGGKLPLLGAAGYKPLKVDVVAEAAVKAIEEESVSGVVDVNKIQELATKAWREAML